MSSGTVVVNCFQFDYFCGYHTANLKLKTLYEVLWIAFNLITFVDITQLLLYGTIELGGCELLSIWLLLWISHSENGVYFFFVLVVNCFQFDYFCGYHTALIGRLWYHNLLWIAFNLITFVDITQLWSLAFVWPCSCELLSIWLLLWISHSFSKLGSSSNPVVNCFQFDYFCGYHTANIFDIIISWKLWIAFNLITFVDITQPLLRMVQVQVRCELLSIWLLLWISHSL